MKNAHLFVADSFLLRCRTLYGLDILSPLRKICSNDASVVTHQAIYLTFDVRYLCPDSSAAMVPFHLTLQDHQQVMRLLVPVFEVVKELVCLLDALDGFGSIP